MSLVINDTVKMEWESDRWIQTKGNKKVAPSLICACKEYETPTGDTLPVYFTAQSAFLYFDDQGTYTFPELRGFLKDNYTGSFPEMYAEYHPLVKADGTVDERLAQEWGVAEYLNDIKARLKDLAPYGEDKDTTL